MHRFNSLLDKLACHYCKTLSPENSGSYFKFTKIGSDYIHTELSGHLFKKQVGKTLFDIFPHEIAERKIPYYNAAWNGNEITYKGHSTMDFDYLAYLVPIYKDNEVVEVIGYGIDISKWDLENQIITLADKNGIVKFASNNAVMASNSKLEDVIDTKIHLHPDDEKQAAITREIIFNTKTPQHMKLRLTFNGVKLTLISIGIPVIHADKVICMLSFSEVISRC